MVDKAIRFENDPGSRFSVCSMNFLQRVRQSRNDLLSSGTTSPLFEKLPIRIRKQVSPYPLFKLDAQ